MISLAVILTAGSVLRLQPHRRAAQVSRPHHPALGVRVWSERSLGVGAPPAVGPCQQSVETVVCAGVVPFVDVAVVDAGAGEHGLVHKQGAVVGVILGLTWCRVLREQAKREIHMKLTALGRG